jgi:hypothetical protein
MITKERLEEAIRGVVHEFKVARRIQDPAAEELTAALEARVENLFDEEAFSYREVSDSAIYVDQLRDAAQLGSADLFLRELTEWQQKHS